MAFTWHIHALFFSSLFFLSFFPFFFEKDLLTYVIREDEDYKVDTPQKEKRKKASQWGKETQLVGEIPRKGKIFVPHE